MKDPVRYIMSRGVVYASTLQCELLSVSSIHPDMESMSQVVVNRYGNHGTSWAQLLTPYNFPYVLMIGTAVLDLLVYQL